MLRWFVRAALLLTLTINITAKVSADIPFPLDNIIAYRVFTGGQQILRLLDVDSGMRYTLTENHGLSNEWSPDGNYIASFIPNPSTGSRIEIFGIGRDDVKFSPGVCFESPYASWMPNSAELVFSGFIGSDCSSGIAQDLFRWQLSASNVNVNPAQILTEAPAIEIRPVVSPDGSQIAFLSRHWETSKIFEDIFVMTSDGGDIQRLTHDEQFICCLEWSPNGEEILYHYRCDETFACRPTIISVDKRTSAALMGEPTMKEFNAAYSPDGRSLLIGVRGTYSRQPMIYRYDISTGQYFELSSGYWPDWSPDGMQILFMRDSITGAGDLYVMNDDGTNIRQLTEGETIMSFAWRPR
ncbi:MAG: hypothetical protein HC828_14765 [Blastochloris sp.]|nr:hypothetical protein [Blastochloris sp.]